MPRSLGNQLRSLANTEVLETGLAGLEPTAYGLGNRVRRMVRLGLAINLPKYLPKSSANMAQRVSIWENRA
jgi:hypothetical protein